MRNSDAETCAETFATLCIYHKDLDPDQVSRELGWTPTEAYKRGEAKDATAKRPVIAKEGAWCFSTEAEVQSLDANRHLEWLLRFAETRLRALQRLQTLGAQIVIFCLWMARGRRGSLELSPPLL